MYLRALLDTLIRPETITNSLRKIIFEISQILLVTFINFEKYDEINSLILLYESELGLQK